MFHFQLFLCILVLAAFSPADSREVYQSKAWRELAATTTPAPSNVVPVPAAPCFQWGCPSKNTACTSSKKGTQGTTGPAGAAASSCIVDYLQITINLNSKQALTAAATALQTATTKSQIIVTLLSLAPAIGNAYGVQFASTALSKNGMVKSINVDITCNNCGQAALATAATNFMNAVPPYMFAAMKLQLVDVWTCMTNDTTADGVCLDNVNLVVGNPPAPTTSNGGAGASVGVIIGAVAGGIVGVLAIAGGVYVYKKRQAQFTTTSRNISSSNATAHTVSGPMSNPAVGMGMNNNFNQGTQMQQMQRPNQYMPNNGMAMNNGMGMQQNNASPRSMPVNGGYGQNQNWNNNQGYNNRGWN